MKVVKNKESDINGNFKGRPWKTEYKTKNRKNKLLINFQIEVAKADKTESKTIQSSPTF